MDPPSITLELEAEGLDDAEEKAQGAVHRMRRAARLPDATHAVVWLAPLGDDDASSQYLEQAKELVHEERYGLAVVAAQIHFEAQLTALLREAAGDQPLRWIARLLKDRGIAELKREVSFATVEVLLGVDVTQVAEWNRFRNHVERRNDVVHKGQTVDKHHAEESIRVVQQLWARLAAAARKQRKEPPSP
jgi:HEPN domain-containing protein